MRGACAGWAAGGRGREAALRGQTEDPGPDLNFPDSHGYELTLNTAGHKQWNWSPPRAHPSSLPQGRSAATASTPTSASSDGSRSASSASGAAARRFGAPRRRLPRTTEVARSRHFPWQDRVRRSIRLRDGPRPRLSGEVTRSYRRVCQSLRDRPPDQPRSAERRGNGRTDVNLASLQAHVRSSLRRSLLPCGERRTQTGIRPKGGVIDDRRPPERLGPVPSRSRRLAIRRRRRPLSPTRSGPSPTAATVRCRSRSAE